MTEGLQEALFLSRAQWAARCRQLVDDWKAFPSVTQDDLNCLRELSGGRPSENTVRHSGSGGDHVVNQARADDGTAPLMLAAQQNHVANQARADDGMTPLMSMIANATLVRLEGGDAVLPEDLFDSILGQVDSKSMRPWDSNIWGSITSEPHVCELLDRSLQHWHAAAARAGTVPISPSSRTAPENNRLREELHVTFEPEPIAPHLVSAFSHPENFEGYPANYPWIEVKGPN